MLGCQVRSRARAPTRTSCPAFRFVGVELVGLLRCAGPAGRWVDLDAKRPHTHDVRTLAVVSLPDEEPLLLSGGNDAQLLAHSVPRFLRVRLSVCLSARRASSLQQPRRTLAFP
jgi:hypothetical protein